MPQRKNGLSAYRDDHCLEASRIKDMNMHPNGKSRFSFVPFLTLLFIVWQGTGLLARADVSTATWNVRDSGAKGDGKTLDTVPIQKAIDDCSSKGGGTVIFPAGNYLIGTLYLKSDVTLNIQANAEIVGTTQLAEYGNDTGISPYYPEDLDKCLIYAKDAKNITLTGAGSINGGFPGNEKPVPAPGANRRDASARPMLIRFDGCENIRLDSIKLYGSSSWCMHFARSEKIVLANLDVPNKHQDGVDFESCEDAQVTGCHFVTGDDCIAILASHNQICRDIAITNCTMQSRCAAIRLGPLSYGDIQNVTASHCQFTQCLLGGVKIGMYEGGTISKCSFTDLQMDQVTCPILIFLGTFYEVGAVTDRRPQMPVGHIDDLTFSNIKATAIMRSPQSPDSNSVMFFQGYPGTDIENIALNHVEMTFPGGGTAAQAERRTLVDMDKIDPNKDGYWTDHKTTFGIAPAAALYARHVHNLTLNDVKFSILAPDARAAVFLNQTSDVKLDGVNITGVPGDPISPASLLVLNSQNVTAQNSQGNPAASTFLSAEGSATKSIVLKNVDFHGIAHPIATTNEAALDEIQTTTTTGNP
jgi:polygalacturonase